MQLFYILYLTSLQSILAMWPFKCYITQMVVGGSTFLEKSITKVFDSTLLALRGGGWGLIFKYTPIICNTM